MDRASAPSGVSGVPFAQLVEGQFVEMQGDLFSEVGFSPFSGRWPRSGICVRGQCFSRPTWERRTAATGYSWSPFALLRTPTAQLAINGGSQPPAKRLAGGHQPTLADQVEQGGVSLLPTPRTTDRGSTEHPSPSTVAGTHGRDLAPTVGAVLLPTPSAGVHNDGETLGSWEARRARLLAKGYNGNGQGTPLAVAVSGLLPTPQAHDAQGPKTAEQIDEHRARQPHRAGGRPPGVSNLNETVLELLPTPTAADGDRTSATFPRGNATLAGTLLPTPRPQCNAGGSYPDRRDRGEGPNLATAVDELPLLPTPAAREAKGPGTGFAGRTRPDGRVRTEADATLGMAVGSLLPTPAASDGKGQAGTATRMRDGRPRPAGDADLSEAVGMLLPTPRPADGISGTPNQRGSSGDLMLAPAVLSLGLPVGMLLPTPSAADGLGGHLTRSGDRYGEELLPRLVRSATEGRKLPPRGSTGSSTARRSRGGKMSPGSGHPTLFGPPS